MAYKPDVHDTRESPSIEVMRQLILREGDVRYCDPWVPNLELDGVPHRSVEWSAESVRDADCVVILTAHRPFLEDPHWREAPLIVDTRNVVPAGPNVRSI
jgi:UDP-N-acetyl-D-glucosamine dehydrogenase